MVGRWRRRRRGRWRRAGRASACRRGCRRSGERWRRCWRSRGRARGRGRRTVGRAVVFWSVGAATTGVAGGNAIVVGPALYHVGIIILSRYDSLGDGFIGVRQLRTLEQVAAGSVDGVPGHAHSVRIECIGRFSSLRGQRRSFPVTLIAVVVTATNVSASADAIVVGSGSGARMVVVDSTAGYGPFLVPADAGVAAAHHIGDGALYGVPAHASPVAVGSVGSLHVARLVEPLKAGLIGTERAFIHRVG